MFRWYESYRTKYTGKKGTSPYQQMKWDLKHYENHRYNVKTAKPQVDCGPPTSCSHLNFGLRRSQLECERYWRVQRDNLELFSKITKIHMGKSRLDPKKFEDEYRVHLKLQKSMRKFPDDWRKESQRLKCLQDQVQKDVSRNRTGKGKKQIKIQQKGKLKALDGKAAKKQKAREDGNTDPKQAPERFKSVQREPLEMLELSKDNKNQQSTKIPKLISGKQNKTGPTGRHLTKKSSETVPTTGNVQQEHGLKFSACDKRKVQSLLKKLSEIGLNNNVVPMEGNLVKRSVSDNLDTFSDGEVCGNTAKSRNGGGDDLYAEKECTVRKNTSNADVESDEIEEIRSYLEELSLKVQDALDKEITTVCFGLEEPPMNVSCPQTAQNRTTSNTSVSYSDDDDSVTTTTIQQQQPQTQKEANVKIISESRSDLSSDEELSWSDEFH